MPRHCSRQPAPELLDGKLALARPSGPDGINEREPFVELCVGAGIRLDGKTILGEVASREVWVAGPGAYVVLKALAFKSRGENKDADDLFYLLRHFGAGIDDVVARLVPLLDDAEAQEAMAVLEKDFSDLDGVGPRRVADFLREPVTRSYRPTCAVSCSTWWRGARRPSGRR